MDKIDVFLKIIPGNLTIEQKRIIKRAIDIDEKVTSCGSLWRAIGRVHCTGVPDDCEKCGLGIGGLKDTVASWGNLLSREEKKQDKTYKLTLKKLRGHNG